MDFAGTIQRPIPMDIKWSDMAAESDYPAIGTIVTWYKNIIGTIIFEYLNGMPSAYTNATSSSIDSSML
jgi:hypothetical protein